MGVVPVEETPMKVRPMTPKNLLAVLVAGALFATVLVMPVGADQDGRPGPSAQQYCRDHPDDDRCERARQEMQNRTANETRGPHGNETRGPDGNHSRGLHGRIHAYCADHPDDRRCERIQDAHRPCVKAKRAERALVRAIEAHERRLERLGDMEERLLERMADDNLSENETERAERRLERIDAAQNRTDGQIERLEAQLERLQARWEAQCADRPPRGGDDDEEEEEEDEDDSTPSPSPTTSSPPGNSTSG